MVNWRRITNGDLHRGARQSRRILCEGHTDADSPRRVRPPARLARSNAPDPSEMPDPSFQRRHGLAHCDGSDGYTAGALRDGQQHLTVGVGFGAGAQHASVTSSSMA